jgi:Mrp family chromosome partitioning ATPase
VPSSHDGAALYLLGALLGGALLGMVAAHAREALDRRIRSIEQAADLIGRPALGVVRSGRRPGGVAVTAADARYVSLAVVKWLDRHPDQPLVVLSGRDDEGRTAVTGNLAVALAEAGHDVWLAARAESMEELKTIVYEGQRRTPPRPRVVPFAEPATSAIVRLNGAATSDQFGAAAGGSYAGAHTDGLTRVSGSGLAPHGDPETTLLIEAQPPADELTPALVDEYGFAVRPRSVLVGSGMVRLCRLGEQPAHGVIVVDAPPSDTDERGVRAAQSGVAVLVVARDRTRNVELSRLVDRLRSAGAKTVGFVLTGSRDA